MQYCEYACKRVTRLRGALTSSMVMMVLDHKINFSKCYFYSAEILREVIGLQVRDARARCADSLCNSK